MGRYIYADEVGISKDDTVVHKFWFAIQPSDVSDYLEMYETRYFAADLDIEHEATINEKIAELKAKFEKAYGFSYDSYMDGPEVNEFADLNTNEGKDVHDRQALASRINLGEHLLETIANMKAVGIEQQQLTIEC
jgi:hypothetical protein